MSKVQKSTDLVILPSGSDTEKTEVGIEIANVIKTEVAKIDISRQAIASLKKKYNALVIHGPEDKKGYEAVDAARKDVKKKAVAVDKKRQEINSNFLKITRGVNEYASDLETPLRELETELAKKLKAIDDQIAEAELEKKQAAEKLLNSRITELEDAGIAFNGRFYSIGENVAVDVIALQSFSGDDFVALLNTVKKEKIRLDEVAEQKRLSDLKEKEEREAETLRLENQRKAQELAQKNLDLQKEELENLLRLAKRNIREERVNALLSAGLGYDHKSDVPVLVLFTPSGNVRITVAEIEEEKPEHWAFKLETIKGQISAIVEKETERLTIAAEKEKQFAFRVNHLEILGFVNIENNLIYTNEVTGNSWKFLKTDIEGFTPENWAVLIKDAVKFCESETAKASKIEREREKEAEKKRKAALSDLELIKEFASNFNDYQASSRPDLKSEKMLYLFVEFANGVENLKSELLEKAIELSK